MGGGLGEAALREGSEPGEEVGAGVHQPHLPFSSLTQTCPASSLITLAADADFLQLVDSGRILYRQRPLRARLALWPVGRAREGVTCRRGRTGWRPWRGPRGVAEQQPLAAASSAPSGEVVWPSSSISSTTLIFRSWLYCIHIS